MDIEDLVECEVRETRRNRKKLKKKKASLGETLRNLVFHTEEWQYGMDSRRRLCVQGQFMNLKPNLI